MAESTQKPVLVVLDDDPTGIQTVKNIEVFMEWEYSSLIKPYSELDGFFILTNSRALTTHETEYLHRDIAHVLCKCMWDTGRRFLLCSRSDSTLRGHYPLETDTLAAVMEQYKIRTDKVIFCPCFVEGGRVTLNGIHYVKSNDGPIPAAQTEFARDPYFGFHHSELVEYIREKTNDRIQPDRIISLTRDDIVSGKSLDIISKPADVAVCDGTCDDDMVSLARAIWAYVGEGNNVLVRCAASLVRALFGNKKEKLLQSGQLINLYGKGGLLIVGSYTAKTTEQLYRLKEFDADWVELDVNGDMASQTEVCINRCEDGINHGRFVILYTSRTLRSFDDSEQTLRFSLWVSKILCDIVGKLQINPRFLITKGGITSYDIGVKGLGVKRATVMGQALEGVPVWNTSGRFKDTPLIIFPGNVGTAESLLELAVSVSTRI